MEACAFGCLRDSTLHPENEKSLMFCRGYDERGASGLVIGACRGFVGALVKPLAYLLETSSRVADSIIGWGSSIGRWGRIENKSVVGEDVHVRVSTSFTFRMSEFCCNTIFVLELGEILNCRVPSPD